MADSDATTDIPIGGGSSDRKRAETVDLSDAPLVVDISDAVSERDKVKFTVHTKTTLPAFRKPDFSVVREHEEFVWLHDRFVENQGYAGYIVSRCFRQSGYRCFMTATFLLLSSRLID